ncbi:MAG: metallophosphoesterase [Aquimonas sp.]|nr:metallophosphoesterase [Aquimonas sp.]
MSRILHLSDTHFGTEQPAVVEALLALAHALAPDAIVLSGDITQRATVEQFRRARVFLDALPPSPRLVLAGNHDVPLFAFWQRLFTPYRRYRQGLGVVDLEPRLLLPSLRVIGVKSTRRRRHIDGEISPRQIDSVAKVLGEQPREALKIVVTHQPLWAARPQDLHNRCHGAEAALQRWVEAGADLFLAGHIHWPFAAALPPDGQAWAVNAGTAVSTRVRPGAPNSVNVIEYAREAGIRTCRLQSFAWNGLDRFEAEPPQALGLR